MEEGIIEVQSVKEELKRPVRIHCEVQKYVSAHADHNELLAFIEACDPESCGDMPFRGQDPPRKIFRGKRLQGPIAHARGRVRGLKKVEHAS